MRYKQSNGSQVTSFTMLGYVRGISQEVRDIMFDIDVLTHTYFMSKMEESSRLWIILLNSNNLRECW